MSWIRRRPLAVLGALALALRVACAVATEYKPLFPAYYYTDADLIHAYSLNALEDIRAGRAPFINGSLSERIQTFISVQMYRAVGPKPLAIKLLNAVLGTLCVLVLARALSYVFLKRAALAAGLLVAVWPSHVFYTSQNLKEAPADLLAYLGLAAALAAISARESAKVPSGALALLAASLLGAGFYRSYVLISLAAGLLLMFALMTPDPARRVPALLAAAVVCATLCLYPWISHRVLSSFTSGVLGSADKERIRPGLIPITYDEFDIGAVRRPTSPAGISAFRKSRQFADRRWAKQSSGREIGTQIYPDAAFETWLDVLMYLPKGAVTVLFMPLPGLYPMDGKPGRIAAAAENVVLLALAALACAGFLRAPKAPARLGLLAFFGAMTAGAALLEFDLGSAGRHKLLYLPMLFPFAAEEALRLFSKERA